ncbi:hypothetical protein T484DRAFT_1767082 [Baffinella frigidus]|nr:hypothetical protein T484DRAFT_1767082 [Cryptophyta sp. CCMP2293]
MSSVGDRGKAAADGKMRATNALALSMQDRSVLARVSPRNRRWAAMKARPYAATALVSLVLLQLMLVTGGDTSSCEALLAARASPPGRHEEDQLLGIQSVVVQDCVGRRLCTAEVSLRGVMMGVIYGVRLSVQDGGASEVPLGTTAEVCVEGTAEAGITVQIPLQLDAGDYTVVVEVVDGYPGLSADGMLLARRESRFRVSLGMQAEGEHRDGRTGSTGSDGASGKAGFSTDDVARWLIGKQGCAQLVRELLRRNPVLKTTTLDAVLDMAPSDLLSALALTSSDAARLQRACDLEPTPPPRPAPIALPEGTTKVIIEVGANIMFTIRPEVYRP